MNNIIQSLKKRKPVPAMVYWLLFFSQDLFQPFKIELDIFNSLHMENITEVQLYRVNTDKGKQNLFRSYLYKAKYYFETQNISQHLRFRLDFTSSKAVFN